MDKQDGQDKAKSPRFFILFLLYIHVKAAFFVTFVPSWFNAVALRQSSLVHSSIGLHQVPKADRWGAFPTFSWQCDESSFA